MIFNEFTLKTKVCKVANEYRVQSHKISLRTTVLSDMMGLIDDLQLLTSIPAFIRFIFHPNWFWKYGHTKNDQIVIFLVNFRNIENARIREIMIRVYLYEI